MNDPKPIIATFSVLRSLNTYGLYAQLDIYPANFSDLSRKLYLLTLFCLGVVLGLTVSFSTLKSLILL